MKKINITAVLTQLNSVVNNVNTVITTINSVVNLTGAIKGVRDLRQDKRRVSQKN